MLVDYEFEELVKSDERVAALGFRPQSEVLANHLLPYAAELDAESLQFLEQVKTNLSMAVMLREMKPACGVWSSRLMKYIRMYGLKFSKEDHIAFIKLVYELVLIPDLEPGKIHKFATLFVMLTKKRHLISPEELTLPWRPLYETGRKIFNKSHAAIGMYHYLSPKRCGKEESNMIAMVRKFLSGTGLNEALSLFGLSLQDENEKELGLEGSLVAVAKCARPYFPLTATKEILEELLPQINPWRSDCSAMAQMAMFLPVALNPKHAAIGHELWIDKLLSLFDTCYNCAGGATDLMMLFAGLAKKNPGAFDWSPHVPKMFSRIMHSLHLPVSYKDMQINKGPNLDTKHLASWIVWSICPDGVVLKHLRSFLAGVDSYLHSANSGRWSFRLRDFLRKLSKEFLNRVRREKKNEFKETWENSTPESYKLSEEDITEFINIVLEPTIQAMYGRAGSIDASPALLNLATLRPALVIPPLVESLQTGLMSLTEPHRVTTGMAAVSSIARAMLRGGQTGYPEGPTQVVPLLMSILPGIDPNDLKKSLVSLHTILIFSWMVPFIDCSSAPEYWNDLTEEERLTCESTAQFEDIVLMFLDRIFVLIESSSLENVRLDTKDLDSFRSKTDMVMETAISSAAFAVLTQCSPKIFKEALRKFKAFATESTFETSVSGSMVGVLLRVFTRVDAESTLNAFVPELCEELCELLTEEALADDNPSRDIVYRLVLLKSAVEGEGTILVKYVMPHIVPVLDKALRFTDRNTLAPACEVLANVMQYISYTEVRELKSCTKDYSEAPQKWLPIREWGHGVPLKDVKLEWYVPGNDEASCAQMLIDRYLLPATGVLRNWAKREVTLSREEMLQTLCIVNSTLACGPLMPQPDEKLVILTDSAVPATSLRYSTGTQASVTLDGKNVRSTMTQLLLDVQARMMADKSDDTKSFDALIHIWEHVLLPKFGRGNFAIETRLRIQTALERAMEGRGSDAKTGGGAMRMLIAEAARLQDDTRGDLMCEAGITPSALQALDALFELSTYLYASVRQQAQARLNWMLSHYPYSFRILIPKLAKLFESIGEGDEWHARHKGALYILLGPRTAPIVAKQDWESARILWPKMLKASLSEKQSIQKLEMAINETLHRNFPTVNTRLVISDSAVEAAKYFLTPDQLNDAKLMTQIDNAVVKEKELSDLAEKNYTELMTEIVEVAENPNIQWRRLESAMHLLTYCPSLQTDYPPCVAKLAVNSLIHDDIAVRRTALRLTHHIIRQCKPKLKTVDVDPYELAGMKRPEKTVPGYRKDLEWTMWLADKGPLNEEEWEKPSLRNDYYGFYTWPEKLAMAAPPNEQVYAKDRKFEDMTESERHLYSFFTDEARVGKLIGFLTVEDKKGKDKFSAIRFCVFKLLFTYFGESVADRFIAAAKAGVEGTQEAPQRFAAEVAAATLRAPRYWTRSRALKMYETGAELITAGLTSITPETLEDWGTALATGVEKLEPRRGATLVARLLEFCVPPPAPSDPALDQNTSFVMSARLYALQGALGSLRWRAAQLSKQILSRLDAAGFIQHPYQIVRESVGSLLMTVFDSELVFPGGEKGYTVCLADFLQSVQPRLAALYDENGDIVIKPATSMPAAEARAAPPAAAGAARGPAPRAHAPALTVGMARLAPDQHVAHHAQATTSDDTFDSEDLPPPDTDKHSPERLPAALALDDVTADSTPKAYARATNLLITVLRACMGITVRSAGDAVRAAYGVVACACGAAGRGAAGAEELPRAAAGLLAALALAHHTPAAFRLALHSLHARSRDRSWWARLACLDFAQPLLFYGLPYLCENKDLAVEAEELSLKLMKDPRLEVRQGASKLFTGLMHCEALPDEEKTLRLLTRSCRSQELVERHFGVLGLCSYLASRPYTIGPKLGAVLEELSRHTNAPDPIPATIRQVLAEFRRTHQDEWNKHREALTEEELDLLADLTSPPSYCA